MKRSLILFTNMIIISMITKNIGAVEEENELEKKLLDVNIDTADEDEREIRDQVVERFDDITKSKGDERSYRGLKLRNGMHVLLVSDPETDRAAASMAVVVGLMHDPDDLPELSHLLEHMLFRGSQKYKAENYFIKFVEDHAGSYDGGTAEGWQAFQWEILSENLAELLDIWAQFFLNPLMDPDVITREIKIVDSENITGLTIDFVRFDQLKKSLSRPGHPHSRFLSGSLENLQKGLEKNGVNIRDRLLDLYREWYSSNIMYLVVLGKEKLDELEEMVVPLFEKVENKNMPKLQYDEQPWGPEQLMKKVYYVPISDMRQLVVRFPLPWVENVYRTSPLNYLSVLIGHEGPGSLTAELLQRDWCEFLQAGYENIPGFSYYYVQIELTEDGLDHVDEIVKLVFQYIHLLKRDGVKEWLFNEIKAVSEMEFLFKDKEEPLEYVQTLSSSLIDYSFEDVLSYHIPIHWNKGVIISCLEYLKPDNMNVLLVSQSYEEIADQTIEWYGVQYKVENISEDLIEEFWNITEPSDKFYLPPANEFIAENFDMYPLNEDRQSEIPHTFHKSSISQFWYKQDNEFEMPRLYIKFNIFSPMTCVDGKNEQLTQLFVDLFTEMFSTEYGYAALLARYNWEIKTIICGLQVNLSGFTEKLPFLLEKLLTKMVDFEWKENRFEIAKESLIRRLEDFHTYQPYSMASSYVWYLLHNCTTNYHPAYESSAVARSIKKLCEGLLLALQVNDMKRLTKQLFSRVFLQGLIYGNADQNLAKNLVSIIESSFSQSSAVLPQEIVFPRVLKMNDKSNFRYETAHAYSKNSCYYGHFQIDMDYPIVNAVLVNLFVKFVHEKCIQKLLVEKILIDMEEEEFKQYQTAVREMYTRKMLNQAQRFSAYWSEICSRRYHFGRGNVKLGILDSLKQKDLLDFFEEYILESGGKRKKLDVYVISEVTNPASEDGVSVDSTKIEDEVLFRSSFSTFPHVFAQMQVAPLGISVPPLLE